MEKKQRKKEILENTFLKGVYDLHVHTSPDVSPRKYSDIELAECFKEAGMAGGAIKNHFADTAGRAAVLRDLYPGLKIAGGIVLNRSVGGLNPEAVEKTAKMGGRMVWFPTLDSLEFQKSKSRERGERWQQSAGADSLLTVFDGNGQLKKEVFEILELAAKYHMVVGTGHISAREGLSVIAAGKERGVERMVVTHADNPSDFYSVEEQREAVRMGAVIEHCYFTSYYGKTAIEEIRRQIEAVGSSRVILSTDFGQLDSLRSDEGMREYAQKLAESGMKEKEIKRMMCDNPAELLEG